MNEKIEKIAKKSGFSKIDGEFYTPVLEHLPVTEHLEKFTKLIIHECIRVPYNMWDKAELNADIALKIERRIKEHFGINDD